MDEELYLHCLGCGEAFDSLRPAFEHQCDSNQRLDARETWQFSISEEL